MLERGRPSELKRRLRLGLRGIVREGRSESDSAFWVNVCAPAVRVAGGEGV